MRSLQSALAVYVATFLICVGLVAVPTACGGNQRQRTLHAALVAANVARDGFVAWDAAHQAKIISEATTREDAEAKLAAYRSRRDRVIEGFERAYRAIATAATQTDRPSLVAAQELGRKLMADLEQIKVAP